MINLKCIALTCITSGLKYSVGAQIEQPVYNVGDTYVVQTVSCLGLQEGKPIWTQRRTVKRIDGDRLIYDYTIIQPTTDQYPEGRIGTSTSYSISRQAFQGSAAMHFEGEWRLAEFPMREGQEWTFENSIDNSAGQRLNRTFKIQPLKRERVTTDAGTFDSLRIEAKGFTSFNWDSQRLNEPELYIGWYVPELKWHAKLRIEKRYTRGQLYDCTETSVIKYTPGKAPDKP